MFRFHLFILFIITCSAEIAFAQSNLPECSADPNSTYDNCYGTIIWPNQDKYVGEFKEDKMNGHGTFTWHTGEKYIGEFRDGKYSGQGTLIFANGSKYVGEFSEGKYSGQGTKTFADGEKYVGEFIDGKYNGQGTLIFADGEKYVGEFIDGKYNGQGTLIFADGSKYVGEFIDGKFSGQGTLILADASKYVGEFRDGQPNGQGIYTWSDGEKYVGEFRDGQPNGQGTKTFANGEKYVGDFKIGERNGYGTYTRLDGTTDSGLWKNGELVKNNSIYKKLNNEQNVTLSIDKPEHSKTREDDRASDIMPEQKRQKISYNDFTSVLINNYLSNLSMRLQIHTSYVYALFATLFSIMLLIIYRALFYSNLIHKDKGRIRNISVWDLKYYYRKNINRKGLFSFVQNFVILVGAPVLLALFINNHSNDLPSSYAIAFTLSVGIMSTCFHEFGHSIVAYLGGDKE